MEPVKPKAETVLEPLDFNDLLCSPGVKRPDACVFGGYILIFMGFLITCVGAIIIASEEKDEIRSHGEAFDHYHTMVSVGGLMMVFGIFSLVARVVSSRRLRRSFESPSR